MGACCSSEAYTMSVTKKYNQLSTWNSQLINGLMIHYLSTDSLVISFVLFLLGKFLLSYDFKIKSDLQRQAHHLTKSNFVTIEQFQSLAVSKVKKIEQLHYFLKSHYKQIFDSNSRTSVPSLLKSIPSIQQLPQTSIKQLSIFQRQYSRYKNSRQSLSTSIKKSNKHLEVTQDQKKTLKPFLDSMDFMEQTKSLKKCLNIVLSNKRLKRAKDQAIIETRMTQNQEILSLASDQSFKIPLILQSKSTSNFKISTPSLKFKQNSTRNFLDIGKFNNNIQDFK